MRAVGKPTRPPLRKTKKKEGTLSVSAFLLPLTASASSLLRQSRFETLLARRVGETREKVVALAAHPFHPRQEKDSQKALARANGTSRRASGWAGENVARSRGSASPPLRVPKKKLGQFQLSFPTEQACEFRSSGESQRQSPGTPLVRDDKSHRINVAGHNEYPHEMRPLEHQPDHLWRRRREKKAGRRRREIGLGMEGLPQ